MKNELTGIEQHVWRTLADAPASTSSAFRYLSLATAHGGGPHSQPMTRTLVLRSVDPERRELEFHTDVRSAKWAALCDNPKVSALGFDALTRVQFCLLGTARLFAPDTARASKTWQALSSWTQNTYCGGPPGDPLDSDMPRDAADFQPLPVTTHGRGRFGVIVVTINSLDWLQLERGNNRRARFEYSAQGEMSKAAWIAP